MIARAYDHAKLVPLKTIYLAIILCFISVFVLGCLAFTIEADESWMLMSTMKIFGIDLVETSAVDHPVTTSGGIYVLIHGLISLLSNDIFSTGWCRFCSLQSCLA